MIWSDWVCVRAVSAVQWMSSRSWRLFFFRFGHSTGIWSDVCMRRGRLIGEMGLLEGVQSLQGPPPPRSDDPLAQFGTGANSLVGDFQNKLSTSMDSFGEGIKGGVTSFRRMIGDESVEDLEAPPQQSFGAEVGQIFNLTMFQRFTLFAMCFGAGVVLVFISFSFLPLIVVVPHKFAASFTMGNVLAILSTWILVGPKAQFQSMFHPVRATAAVIYLASLAFALFAAFFGGKLRYILVLMSLVIEIGALSWYSLSYIPYGRYLISQMCGISSW